MTGMTGTLGTSGLLDFRRAVFCCAVCVVGLFLMDHDDMVFLRVLRVLVVVFFGQRFMMNDQSIGYLLLGA